MIEWGETEQKARREGEKSGFFAELSEWKVGRDEKEKKNLFFKVYFFYKKGA